MSDIQEAAAKLLRALDRMEHNDRDLLEPLPGWGAVRTAADDLREQLEAEEPEVDEASYARGWNACRESAAARLLPAKIEETL